MCFAWFTQQSKIIITKNIHINSNITEVSCCCLLVLLDYDLDYSWLTWARISGLSASRGLFSTYFLSLTLNNKAVKTNSTFFFFFKCSVELIPSWELLVLSSKEQERAVAFTQTAQPHLSAPTTSRSLLNKHLALSTPQVSALCLSLYTN